MIYGPAVTNPDVLMTNRKPYERPINKHKVFYHITRNDETGVITIVAKLHDYCAEDVLRHINWRGDFPFNISYLHKKFSKCLMPAHPTARATCDPRDEYDEEYGKQLAYDRLKIGYWSQFEDRMGKFNDVLLEEFDKNSDEMTKISETYLQEE